MTTLPASTSEHPFDWVDDIVFILDAECRITFVNAHALDAWGKQTHELLGQTFEEAFPTKAGPNVLEAFRQALKTRLRTEFATFGLRHQTWINITLHPHHDSLIVQVRPLLQHMGTTIDADYDALTGCLTRTAFQNILTTRPLPYALAIVDLNKLKSVNTLRGHSGGDTHIRTTALALREALPAEALICRWGGDEFLILTPGRDRQALQALLDETNALLPRPQPDVLAFTAGLAVREYGTAYERAFALADEQLQLRKEQHRQADPTDHETASFITFSQELEALRDPGDVIQYALNRLLNLLDFDQAVFAAFDGHEVFHSHAAHREGIPVLLPGLNVRAPLPELSLVQSAKRTRTTTWSTDYEAAPNRMPDAVAQGVKSALVTPVFSQGEVIATIILCSVRRWQTITPHMRKVVELTALRLEHALELRRAVSEVRSTLEAGMLTLGIVLEARDFETHGHTHRATLMAERIGEQLGLTDGEIGQLSQGAYLHDLGKLCVPDEVLKKPGKLTPEEWTVMQGHTVQGYDLASRIAGLSEEALGVIRSHHERWDGTGYPDGLAGTDIPLGARIFAVCDVYDALISDRPYKCAWSHEDACVEIEQQSGRHFDPKVVRAFLHLTRHPDHRQTSPEQHTGNSA